MQFPNTEIKHLQAYRPVASTAAGSALAAFIDLRDSGGGAPEADPDSGLSHGDKERQRKFLLQLQRTKWLAQHGKLANNSDKVTSNSVRMKELSMSSAQTSSDKSELTHMERMRKDRNAYSSE